MKKPEIPHNEEKRLQSLRSLEILDTAAEERFDRLTRLAKRMFNVPIALVSIIDENRQWFKSCDGLDVRETPRDISFCGHTILGTEVFIISDASRDIRFADNPLVLNNPNIRFYAGCPLRHLDGSMMGTLCIIDEAPRTLENEDVAALQDLAELAERELAAVQLATLDELTKISNRRGFTCLGQKLLSFCEREEMPATLVFLDLNNFKPINDSFGHAEGDKALKVFAKHLKSNLRGSDVFARLGGDEFVMLLSNTTTEMAEETIKRLRETINAYNVVANRGYDISFSVGMVNVDKDDNTSIEELLKTADEMMYEQKHSRADCSYI